MKLVSIELENLNSLYGPQSVDLESDLRDAPLFLIVGPTGSGKSTLVDAVSLALFGATARLTRPTSTSGDPWDLPDDPRQLVSRGTIRGWARVVFEKNEGGDAVRYRALWECHRSRKQIDGALQKPRRTLEAWNRDAGAWETRVSSDKNKEFAPHFEGALDGLTIDDFHRCMVLPQGEFAAFLHASPEERSAILERLTDTAAYKRYGERANERRQDAQKQHDELLAQRTGIDAPDEHAVAAMQAEERAHAESVVAMRTRARDLAAAQAWFAAERASKLRHEESVRECEAIDHEWAERREDVRRLEAHDRFAEVRTMSSRVDQQRAALAAAEHASANADARRRELLEERARVDESSRAADAEYERCVRTRDAKTEEIAAARAAWSQFRVADDVTRRAIEGVALAEKFASERVATRDRSAEAERLAAANATEAEARFATVMGDAHIVTERGAWRANAGGLASERESIARQRRNLDALGARATARKARLDELAKERAAYDASVSEAQRVHAEAVRALDDVLSGEVDVAAARSSAERRARELRDRSTAIDAAQRAHEAHRALRARIEEIGAERARLEVVRLAAVAAIDTARAARTEHERAIDTTRARREEIAFAIGLGRERHRLHEGEACPLCGATDHPYAHDREQSKIAEELARRAAQLDEELAARTEQRDAAVALLERAREESTETRGRIESLDRDSLRLEAEEREASDVVARALQAASLAAGETEFGTRRDEVRAALARLDASRQALERAERDLQSSRERLRKAEDALRDCDAAASALTEIERAESQQARAWHDEIELATTRVDREEKRLVDAMASHGIRAATLDEAIRTAEARSDAYEAARVKHEAAARTHDAARAALARCEESVVEASAACERQKAALQTARHELESARRAKEGLLDGADPDTVQAALQRAIDAAAASQRLAHERRSELSVRLAEADASWRVAEASTRTLASELDAAAKKFASACSELGIDAGEVMATALDEATRSRLIAWRSALERRDADARARRDDRAAEVARHATERRADWETLDAESIGSRVAESAAELEHHEHILGALRARIADAVARRGRASALDTSIAQSREALDVWQRLHGLIGVRNGEAFRQFAQSLNLDELIAHANEHLARLAPRYRLDRVPAREGEVSLAFAVSDAWHADESRPLSTLSGGETFLVSLGLALGLAGMRNVRLPIETLLLDEGFGTLDPETLDTAIDALDGLRERGIAQVGIITHVASLRERIEARVLIERVSPGRSRVRVEHGGVFSAHDSRA